MRSVTSHGIDGAILANPELDHLRLHRHRISLRRTSDLGVRIVKTCPLFFQLQSSVCHVTQNEGKTVPFTGMCGVVVAAPFLLNLAIKRGSVASFTSQRQYTPGE